MARKLRSAVRDLEDGVNMVRDHKRRNAIHDIERVIRELDPPEDKPKTRPRYTGI